MRALTGIAQFRSDSRAEKRREKRASSAVPRRAARAEKARDERARGEGKTAATPYHGWRKAATWSSNVAATRACPPSLEVSPLFRVFTSSSHFLLLRSLGLKYMRGRGRGETLSNCVERREIGQVYAKTPRRPENAQSIRINNASKSLVSAVYVPAQLRGRGRGRTLLLLFGEGGGQDDAVLHVQVAQLGRHVVARHAFPDDRLHKAWYSRARALLG